MSLDNLLSSKTRLIQYSLPRTGSTLLVNILYGLFCPQEPVAFIENPFDHNLTNNFIIKTHNTYHSIKSLKKNIHNYNLFFICSQRPELWGKKKLDNSNIIVFDYSSELLEKIDFTIDNIVSNIIDKLKIILPEDIMKIADKNSAIERVNRMNDFYKTIEYEPFSYYDEFYHLHGSHRNRYSI